MQRVVGCLLRTELQFLPSLGGVHNVLFLVLVHPDLGDVDDVACLIRNGSAKTNATAHNTLFILSGVAS